MDFSALSSCTGNTGCRAGRSPGWKRRHTAESGSARWSRVAGDPQKLHAVPRHRRLRVLLARSIRLEVAPGDETQIAAGGRDTGSFGKRSEHAAGLAGRKIRPEDETVSAD